MKILVFFLVLVLGILLGCYVDAGGGKILKAGETFEVPIDQNRNWFYSRENRSQTLPASVTIELYSEDKKAWRYGSSSIETLSGGDSKGNAVYQSDHVSKVRLKCLQGEVYMAATEL